MNIVFDHHYYSESYARNLFPPTSTPRVYFHTPFTNDLREQNSFQNRFVVIIHCFLLFSNYLMRLTNTHKLVKIWQCGSNVVLSLKALRAHIHFNTIQIWCKINENQAFFWKI